MRLEKFYMPTLKEDPQEAEVVSHKLLLRAGMIRSSASGIYSYLPLGYRVVRKIENLVREGIDASGAQEIYTPAIQPKEIWDETGRWETFGPEMFKIKDRHDRDFCLGPTAEEYFTNLLKGELKSYKQLPLVIYQITSKYRDEKRPRFGVNRSREFLMKDSYSFDVDEEAAKDSYKNQWKYYEKIFDKIGLEYKIVLGDSGAMGGDMSHEFIAISETGEGVIAYCDDCDYAATDEKAGVVLEPIAREEEERDLEEVFTPNARTIADLANMLEIEESRTLKAIDLNVGGQIVIVFVPGHRDLNMTKLANYLGVPGHEIEMATDEEIIEVTGALPGFTGPVGLDPEKVRIVVDKRVAESKNLTAGANKTDYHVMNVNYGRDFEGEIAEDLLEVRKGDKCPKCDSQMIFARGIEVGNIFLFADKYSRPIGASFLDENGKENFFYMGSYGIGITRTVSAVVEQYHDEDGIIWPLEIAPYHAIVTIVNTKSEDQLCLGEEIYEKLQDAGVEVMLDDRKDRAGVKFNDRDLIGIPLRITVGKMAGDGIVEFSTRAERENENISSAEAIERVVDRVREAKSKEWTK